MPVDPSYSVRLGWFATDLDPEGHIDAAQVPYDNATSGLTATDAQAAIDEVASGANPAAIAALGFVGPILMTDGITDPPEPMWNEAGDDYLYADLA